MKKIIFTLVSVIAIATLTSFAIDRHHPQETDMGNDVIFHKSVEGWSTATRSTTLYIYYMEGNGEREYLCSLYSGSRSFQHVKKNHLFRSKSCNDFRRNYQYISYDHYFNCDLPKFNQ